MTPSSPNKSLNLIFRRQLASLLEDREITHQVLADALGVPITTVNRWLHCNKPKLPNLVHLLALADYFETTICEFIKENDRFSDASNQRLEYHSILFRNKRLIQLVREPRESEKNGVEVTRKLCEGMSPEKIMEELHCNETQLGNYLRRASYGDLLKVNCQNVPLNKNLAKRLQDKYRLKFCKVANIQCLHYGVLQTVILGALGADYVMRRAQVASQFIGLAGGLSCARIVMSLVQADIDEKITILPIAVSSYRPRVVALDASTLMGMFGYLSGHTKLPQAIKPDHSILETAKQKTSIAFLGFGGKDYRKIFDLGALPASDVDNGYTGGVQENELADAHCIGDILYNFGLSRN